MSEANFASLSLTLTFDNRTNFDIPPARGGHPALPPVVERAASAWTTGIGVRRTPFRERLCPVVTRQRQWRGIARMRRRIARTRYYSFRLVRAGHMFERAKLFERTRRR